MIEVLDGSKPVSVDPAQLRTGLEILRSFPQFDGNVIGMKWQGPKGMVVYDLHTPLPPLSGKIEWVKRDDSPEALEIMRHSAAHILAQAVKALYPEVQVTIGPVVENGFYYDFSKKGGFKEEELPAIENKMKEIIKARHPLKREEWPTDKAIEFFKKLGEHYKCEIIEDLKRDQGVEKVSVYWQGDFADLCRGPHVPTTGHIGAVKLTSLAGAYWRGDEKNEMLSRVYGTAFSSKESLNAYMTQIEEAKRRDHRRIGVDLSLFSFHAEAPAAPFFHPAGAHLFISLQDFLRDLNRANGFEDVISPLIMSEELWKLSGHYDNYRENMYFTQVDERGFAVKPMNCPGHCLIYKTGRHSYRELPMRLAEFGRVHRHERSGVTQGLFRVRSFTQDDAHIYCAQDQIESEITHVLKMIDFFYKAFGFEYRVELSTRPEKRMGDESVWDQAEQALRNSLQQAGYDYKLNPGDGAFYGPKIDTHLKDSIGRWHQCGTVQLDFSMPARFGLEYLGSDNKVHTPVMIHRAIAGSLDRFLGILIEHYAGTFPLWLAPTQAAILSVSDEAQAFSQELYNDLKARGYRVKIDLSSDKLSGKIKRFQVQKIPYMIIIGGREAAARQLSLRLKSGEQRQGLSLNDLLAEFNTQSRPQIPTV